MSDRAPLTVVMHDCPVEEVAAVLAVLQDQSVAPEFADVATDVLHTKMPYVDPEMRLGGANEVATALISAASGCAFATWQEPKYEYDGVLVMHHPALGRFESGCNANGRPHLSLDDVGAADARCRALIPEPTVVHLAAELRRTLGVPWTTAFDACVQRTIVALTSPTADDRPTTVPAAETAP